MDTKVCSIRGCDAPPVCRSWCDKHYTRWKRHGDPEKTLYREYFPPEATPDECLRIVGWTEVPGPLSTPCWEWAGTIQPNGYGKISIRDKITSAHRLAHEVWVGPIPDGMHVLHGCDNKPCINPEHLRSGTPSDNMRDMVLRGRAWEQTGDKGPRAKLTWEQVRAIRSSDEVQTVLAERYGVTQTAISLVRSNKTWVDPDYTPR